MGCTKGMLSSIMNKNDDDNDHIKNKYYKFCSDQERNFLENGSMLLEDLIAFSNGKYNIPIRRFSIDELSQATNGFSSDRIVTQHNYYAIYKGSYEKCLIFIKTHGCNRACGNDRSKFLAIRDMVVSTLMSSQKNALKLLGCCLDFEIPALVYECTGTIESLSNRLHERSGGMMEINGSLTWKSRLKIANDIAYAVVYMHTAFPTPIIHRDLKPANIVIDQYGVAKLIDFAISVSLPAGETEVEEVIIGTYGYLDPVYLHTSILTTKSDVYCFGVFLLEFLTGKKVIDCQRVGKHRNLAESVKYYVDINQFIEVVDPRILEECGGIAQEQQLQAVLSLALRCTQLIREDRPEMIDVAKELRQMLKSVCPSLPQPP